MTYMFMTLHWKFLSSQLTFFSSQTCPFMTVFQLAGSFRGVFTLRHSPRELFTRLADGAELGHGFGDRGGQSSLKIVIKTKCLAGSCLELGTWSCQYVWCWFRYVQFLMQTSWYYMVYYQQYAQNWKWATELLEDRVLNISVNKCGRCKWIRVTSVSVFW